MAYSIGGKMYTDHALMDEVTYATKIILNEIILKNEKKANANETEESMIESDILLAIDNNSAQLSYIPLNEEILINFGYTYAQAKLIQGTFNESTQTYHNNLQYVPEEDKQALYEYASKWFVDHYEEKNNYYRMLNGLPEYGTKDYYIYIKESKYPNIPDLSLLVDLSKPVHAMSNTEINTLDSLGILDDIKKQYKGLHYKYLYHLGATKIDIVLARKAKIWDILYMPAVEYLVSSRFQELFQVNRDLYYRYTHQLAYEYNSDYYDEMMMFIILCQTFADIITDLPEWYIRRDVFDLRTCQYFLESQGVKFFKEIPLKFQIRIVKNLNKLIRYKSTTKNIHDILEIFGMEGTTVYKYYIFKKLTKKDIDIDPNIHGDDEWTMPTTPFDYGDEGAYGDEPSPPTAEESITCLDHAYSDEYAYNPDGTITIKFYEFGDESASEAGEVSEADYAEDQRESRKTYVDEYGNTYDLELIKVPIDESYDKYIRNNLYRDDYDTITSQDQYWDGEDVHNYVKNLHLEKDFTIEGTKYMFLDNRVSMREYSYQMSYFLNLIFSSKIDTDSIVIKVPTIKSNAEFSLTNLCLLLYVLSQAYTNHTLDVKYPSDHRHEHKGEFEEYEDFDGGGPQKNSYFDTYFDVDGGYMNKIIDNYDPSTPEYDINGHIIRPIMHTLGPYFKEKYRWNVNGGYSAFFTEFTELTLLYWIKQNAYEMFNNDCDHPVLYGFNMDADLDKIAIDISLRHSSFLFEHGFSLEDFGVENFITTKKINTIDDLIEVYRTNTKAYDNLYNKMVYENDSEDKMIVMEYIFRNLFTIPYDKDFYKLKNGEYTDNYGELLRQKDYTLYKFYSQIMAEKDEETKKDNIRLALNEITDTLEFYIKAEDTKWVFSFVPTNSLEAVNHYISLMINFFKSWKVYFLDPHVTYVLDSRLENKIFMNDTIIEFKEKWWYYDKEIMQDALMATDKYFLRDEDASGKQEIVDIYGYTQWLATDDIDFDGLYADADPGAPPPFTDDLELVNGTNSVMDAEIEYILLGGDAYNLIATDNIILNGGDAEYVTYVEEEFIISTMGASDRTASYIYYGLDSTMTTVDQILNGGDSDTEVIVTIIDAGQAPDYEATLVYNGLGSYERDYDEWLLGGDSDDSDLPVQRRTSNEGIKIFTPSYPDSLIYYLIDVSTDYNILYNGCSIDDISIIQQILYGGDAEDEEPIYPIEYGGDASGDFDEKGHFVEFRNLNGGGPQHVDCAPYWMINGGIVSARKEIYDLDGGSAFTARDYLEVDGLHILIDKGNYWPIDQSNFQTISFEVDGGWVDQDKTKGTSIVNTIKGHTIKNELLLSSYPKNSIELYEDGAYLGGENFVYLTDVEELRYQILEDRENYEEDLNNCLKIVRMMNNPEVMGKVIDDMFADYFAISKQLLDDYLNGLLVSEALGQVSIQVAELKNWFIELDVFGWDYF